MFEPFLYTVMDPRLDAQLTDHKKRALCIIITIARFQRQQIEKAYVFCKKSPFPLPDFSHRIKQRDFVHLIHQAVC